MSWTQHVTCNRCGGCDWEVQGGQWTCGCGKPMAVSEIAEYHAALDTAREADNA